MKIKSIALLALLSLGSVKAEAANQAIFEPFAEGTGVLAQPVAIDLGGTWAPKAYAGYSDVRAALLAMYTKKFRGLKEGASIAGVTAYVYAGKTVNRTYDLTKPRDFAAFKDYLNNRRNLDYKLHVALKFEKNTSNQKH